MLAAAAAAVAAQAHGKQSSGVASLRSPLWQLFDSPVAAFKLAPSSVGAAAAAVAAAVLDGAQLPAALAVQQPQLRRMVPQ